MGVNVPQPREFDWLTIKDPKGLPVLPLVTDLGKGEIEVLALALEDTELVAVLDDRLARTFAQSIGVAFTGTLGLLLDAKQKHLIEDVAEVVF